MITKAKQQNTQKIPKLRFPGFDGDWNEKKWGDFLRQEIREVDKPRGLYKALGIRSHFKGTFQKLETDPEKNSMDKLYVVHEGDFIVNITFAWEGALAIAKKDDEDGLVSFRFPTYVFDKNIANSNYFRYIFPTKKIKDILDGISPGGAGRNRVLNKKDLLKIKVNLPVVAEQRKIADFLGSVDFWLDNLRKQKEFLESYKKGMMQKIFSQEIRFKDENGKAFPEWKEKKLSQFGEIFNGLVGKSGGDFGDGEPFITYKQIFDNSEIDINKFSLVKVDGGERQNKCQYGDIFFTTSSETSDEVGLSSVLLEKNVSPYLNSFSFGYRPNSLNELNPCFAKFLFRNFLFRRKVVKLAQGSTRYNISKIEFIKIKVLLPEINEQNKIANFLTSLDGAIESKQQEIIQTEQWKSGLIQELFI